MRMKDEKRIGEILATVPGDATGIPPKVIAETRIGPNPYERMILASLLHQNYLTAFLIARLETLLGETDRHDQ